MLDKISPTSSVLSPFLLLLSLLLLLLLLLLFLLLPRVLLPRYTPGLCRSHTPCQPSLDRSSHALPPALEEVICALDDLHIKRPRAWRHIMLFHRLLQLCQ